MSKFYSAPAKPPMQPSSVAAHNMFTSPRGRKTAPPSTDQPPSYTVPPHLKGQTSNLQAQAFMEQENQVNDNVEDEQMDENNALNTSIQSHHSETTSTTSNIEDLLNEFKKELASIRQYDIFTPQKSTSPATSYGKPTPLKLMDDQQHHQASPPVTPIVAAAATSSLLANNVSTTTTRLPTTMSNNNNHGKHIPTTATTTAIPLTTTIMSSPPATPTETINNNNTSPLTTTNSDKKQIQELKIQNIQLRTEVTKLHATVGALQMRLETMEKNFDQVLQMLMERNNA